MTNNENPISLDGAAANKLNPFISEDRALQTFRSVSAALKGLATVVCMCENQKAVVPDEASLSLLQDQLRVIAAALDFECEQNKAVKPEASVKTKTKKHDYIVPLSPPPR